MELQYYLNILWRRKWLILLSMLLTAALAFLFIHYKSSKYQSDSVIATGVVDYTGISSDKNNAFMQQLQVEMRFDNLIEFMSSRQCMNFLTFSLVHHDLEALANGTTSFKKEVDLSGFNSEKLGQLSDLLSIQIEEKNPTFDDPADELFFNKVAKAFKYDFEKIKEDHIKITRIGKTDYVKIAFLSDSPEFSYFGASAFTQSFIEYFEKLRQGEDEGTLSYLRETVAAKKLELENKQNTLRNYRSKGGIVDLESQKKATVSQIQRLEQERELELSTVLANKKTIIELERLIQKEGLGKEEVLSKTDDKATRILANKAIVNLKKQIATYERQLIDSGGNKKDIASRLSLTEKALDKKLKDLAKLDEEEPFRQTEREDNTISNNLIDRKVQAKIDLTSAEEKLKLIQENLHALNSRIQSYVTNESFLTNLDREIDLSSEEYKKLAVELSKEELKNLKGDNPLRIIEHAQVPEEPEPNKKLLISAFSGVVGAGMSTFLIFLMTFLDKSINSPNQFKNYIDLPLIGSINEINVNNLNMKTLFNGQMAQPSEEKFREFVKNLRFNMEREEGKKIYLVTSPRQNDGKSFLIANLAHSLAVRNRTVLVIDTNFKKNTLSNWSENTAAKNGEVVEALVNNKLLHLFSFSQLQTPYENRHIDLLRNSGKAASLLEGVADTNFKDFLQAIRPHYDYILLEGAALNDYSDSKELLAFADRVIAIFNADTTLQPVDKNSIEFLQSLNGQFMGSVLNKIDLRRLN